MGTWVCLALRSTVLHRPRLKAEDKQQGRTPIPTGVLIPALHQAAYQSERGDVSQHTEQPKGVESSRCIPCSSEASSQLSGGSIPGNPREDSPSELGMLLRGAVGLTRLDSRSKQSLFSLVPKLMMPWR